jgi:hypothetical protein
MGWLRTATLASKLLASLVYRVCSCLASTTGMSLPCCACPNRRTRSASQMAWRELLARDQGFVLARDFISAIPACPCGKTCASDGTSLLRCSHCKASWYCSRSCQMADRSSHKRWCLQPPSLRARTHYMTLFNSKCAGCHSCLRAPFQPEPLARLCSNCFNPVCGECHCPCACMC